MENVNCSKCKFLEVEAEIEPCDSCDAAYSNFESEDLADTDCIICPFVKATQCSDCTKDWDSDDLI